MKRTEINNIAFPVRNAFRPKLDTARYTVVYNKICTRKRRFLYAPGDRFNIYVFESKTIADFRFRFAFIIRRGNTRDAYFVAQSVKINEFFAKLVVR